MLRKLRLDEYPKWNFHRFGWDRVLSELDEHLCWSGGMRLIGACEHFAISGNSVSEPWVGFVHLCPRIPTFVHELYPGGPFDLEMILEHPGFRRNLTTCQGLFVLSRHLERFLAPRVPVPVRPLFHPSGPASKMFSVDAFRANGDPKIVMVGHWLRRYHSIFDLRVSGLSKVWLQGHKNLDTTSCLLAEGKTAPTEDVAIWSYISNEAYDDLLSANIVFLDLYAASANNAIVDCMVRGTPILVRRHEAVEEYLGHAYPFYFECLDEASDKAHDQGLVADAHRYLLESGIQENIRIQRFLDDVAASSLYASIPCNFCDLI